MKIQAILLIRLLEKKKKGFRDWVSQTRHLKLMDLFNLHKPEFALQSLVQMNS